MQSETANILSEYQKLQKIRRQPDFRQNTWIGLIIMIVGFLCGLNILLLILGITIYLVLSFIPYQSDKHSKQCLILRTLVRLNQDDLVELLTSGKLSEEEISELMFFGVHGGSVAKRHNEYLAPLMRKLRERKGNLPSSVVSQLNWLERVHDW